MAEEIHSNNLSRERIHERALELKNSELWNFKQYEAAAKWTGRVGIALDSFTAIVGGLLLYLLTRSPQVDNMMYSVGAFDFGIPDVSMMLLVFSFLNVFWKPSIKSKKYARAGQKHQRLFDDISDFIKLDVENEQMNEPELRSRYDALLSRRHELKDSNPELDGIWYQILKRNENQVYEQAATPEEDVNRLS